MEDKLKEYNPNLSYYSLRTYISLFNTICKKIGEVFNDDKKYFKIHKEAIMNYINTIGSQHSRKTKLAALIVMGKAYNANEKDLKPYLDEIEKLSHDIETRYQSHEMSDDEEENWMSIPELQELIAKVEKRLIKIADVDTHKEYITWMFYFLLSMIVNGKYALRNNWVNMKIIKTSDIPIDKTHNYIIWNRKTNKISGSIILNSYKTVKTYGVKTIPITQPELLSLLPKIQSLIDKKSNNGYLIVKADGDSIGQDQFSKWLASLFKQYSGKHLTTTSLRHIIASSLWSKEDMKKQEEREKTADIMGHSEKEQYEVYAKKQ
jgi:integrase